LNKSVQTGDFYTQTLVTYDTSEDAKLATTPLRCLAAQTIWNCWTKINCHKDSNENQQ